MALSSCTRRGSQQDDLCPSVFQTTRGVGCSHSICFVPHTPHIPLFILGWRDLTCSVIARRNCCTHSVILGALLWSFSISTVPLFFEMKGSELQPVFKVWVEHGLPMWYNDFLILCSFPNNPEHTICLFWLLSSIELVFSWTCLSYTEDLTFEW